MTLTSDVIMTGAACYVTSIVTHFVIEQFAFFDFVFALDFIFFASAKIFRLNSRRCIKLWIKVAITELVITTKHENGVAFQRLQQSTPPLRFLLVAIWIFLVGWRRGKAVGTTIDEPHSRVNKSVDKFISRFENKIIFRRVVEATNYASYDMSSKWN